MKGDKKDVDFLKTCKNPLNIIREIYKEKGIDESKPVDADLGVDIKFNASKDDEERLKKLTSSIYDLIDKFFS